MVFRTPELSHPTSTNSVTTSKVSRVLTHRSTACLQPLEFLPTLNHPAEPSSVVRLVSVYG